MAELNQVYRCNICGNIISVVHAGGGKQLVCCGQPMELLAANSVDASKEKHIPVIDQSTGQVTVKVGSVSHPMEEKHYIEWIELTVDGVATRKFLNPGDAPEAVFCVCGGSTMEANCYCNLHGLWKSA